MTNSIVTHWGTALSSPRPILIQKNVKALDKEKSDIEAHAALSSYFALMGLWILIGLVYEVIRVSILVM